MQGPAPRTEHCRGDFGPQQEHMSPHRDRPAEESLQLFWDMRDGKYDEGALTLRLKMDWTSHRSVGYSGIAQQASAPAYR